MGASGRECGSASGVPGAASGLCNRPAAHRRAPSAITAHRSVVESVASTGQASAPAGSNVRGWPVLAVEGTGEKLALTEFRALQPATSTTRSSAVFEVSASSQCSRVSVAAGVSRDSPRHRRLSLVGVARRLNSSRPHLARLRRAGCSTSRVSALRAARGRSST